jgi:hypothetical protein
MKFGHVFAGATIAVTLFSGASQAATIVSDFATWAADVNSQYAETSSTGLPLYTAPVPGFSLPYGTTVSLANGSGDIVLQPLNGWGPWSGTYSGDIVDTLGQSETLYFGGTPLYAFGMSVEPDVGLFGPYDESFTVTLSDGTTTTISGSYPPGTSQFIGFVGAGITSITVAAADNPDFAFGDFVSAPEPMSLTVLASGITVLGAMRRKAAHKAKA